MTTTRDAYGKAMMELLDSVFEQYTLQQRLLEIFLDWTSDHTNDSKVQELLSTPEIGIGVARLMLGSVDMKEKQAVAERILAELEAL